MRHVQLRAFHHVALNGGFSKAAEALGLSQPAISDQVRRLEAEYDVVLFNRRRRQVVPTAAGRRLLEVTRRLFAAEEEAHQLLAETRALRGGTLRIVADAAFHVLDVLVRFRAAFPQVRIAMHAGNTAQVVERLHAYEADVGVLGELPEGREFRTLRLSSEPIVAFAVRGHRAAERGSLGLAEVCAGPLVMREKGSMTRERLEAEAARRGLVPAIAVEAEGREAVREIVASGLGIGIVSAAEFGQDPRLVQIPISDCVLRMDEALICLRERAGARLIAAFFAAAEATSQ